MRLVLVRHGQTSANVSGALDTGAPGADLTELGRRQADAVPAGLAPLVDGDVVTLLTSTLVRTQQTAAPLAASLGLEPVVLDGLREISAGELEMRTDEAARTAYLEVVDAWMHGDHAAALPGGESGTAFLERYAAALAPYVDRDGAGTVVAVSHGAAIRTATAYLAQLPVEQAVRLSILNTGAAVLEPEGADGWRLVHWSTEPLGGAGLADLAAPDPTGESAEEALEG